MVCTTTCCQKQRYAAHILFRRDICNKFVQYLLMSFCMQLKLLVGDSKRDAKEAMAEAYHLAQRGCVGLIGPAQSGAAKEVATLLQKIPGIDRTMIGYSSTSPDLSAPHFSNVLRTPPSDDVIAKTMTTLMTGMLVSWAVVLSRQLLEFRMTERN